VTSVPHLALAVLDLFIGQTGLAVRAEVDGCLRLVGETLLIELKEYPLSPLVVFLAVRGDLAVPVIGESETLNLLSEMIYVLFCGDLRMCSRLDRIILRRQSERIEAHGMKDIVAVHPQEPAVDVCCGIPFGMTYMQSCTGGIGEHVEHITSVLLVECRILSH
jgi:hypothetical protein